MPWEDPIVEEVRKVRDAYAQRFNYDLAVIYRDLKEKEHRSGRVVVPCRAKEGGIANPDEAQGREAADPRRAHDRRPRAVPAESERVWFERQTVTGRV